MAIPNNFLLTNGDCSVSHNGYHYSSIDSTCLESGRKEFWTCCTCHEVFLERPAGTFVDRGTAQYSYELPDNVVAPLAEHQYALNRANIGYSYCAICKATELMTNIAIKNSRILYY